MEKIFLRKEYKIIFETSFGNILIKEFQHKIHFIKFTKEKPITSESILLKKAKLQISEFINKKRKSFSFDTYINGTEFQLKVWKEIKKIKYGKTKSYLEIAKTIGTSPRAVGNACSKNKCLIYIPCHRVIASNGKLLGFTSVNGIKTKKQLLFLENSISNTC